MKGQREMASHDNTIGADTSLPAAARLDSRVQGLVEMGFQLDHVIIAIERCKGDTTSALELLSTGFSPEASEFELELRRTKGESLETFLPEAADLAVASARDDVLKASSNSSSNTAHLEVLTDMGFDAHLASQALRITDNDLTRAIEVLSGQLDDLSA